MSTTTDKIIVPNWATIHELSGEELTKMRAYNRTQDVHEDRFRYFHLIPRDNDEPYQSICGTKYNPQDKSGCIICRGAHIGVTKEKVLQACDDYFAKPPWELWSLFDGWIEETKKTKQE
jgi:hypothetical protein